MFPDFDWKGAAARDMNPDTAYELAVEERSAAGAEPAPEAGKVVPDTDLQQLRAVLAAGYPGSTIAPGSEQSTGEYPTTSGTLPYTRPQGLAADNLSTSHDYGR